MPRQNLATAADAAAPGGLELPDLDVLAELGRGADSVVYRARRNGTEYAVKVLNPSPGDLDRVLAYFRREAALLASVNHPRLPRIHEVGHVGSRPYMVMDLAEGRPLSDLIRGGALSVPRAIGLMLDVVEPLALLHDQGLVHRDIKPQNVMVLTDGSARLIDFGLATRETPARRIARRGGPEVSAATVGTLAYAAPEQAGTLRRPVDNRSDLYSVGVMLYECITGSLPFTSSDAGELLRMHALQPAPDLREAGAPGAGISAGIAAVTATLLAKDPDDRYGSAHALIADLQRLLDEPDAAIVPGAATVPRHEGRLSGRDKEIGRLMSRWQQARTGSGAACLLRGPEGIGLSSIALHVAEQARKQGAVVLTAICHDDDAVPLAPLRTAIETLLREAQAQSPSQRQLLHNRIRAAAGGVAPLLAALSPALEAVLGTGPLQDGDRQQQFSSSVAAFIADLARMCGGMVLVLDDIHHADPGTLQALMALAPLIAEVPLMSIATTRTPWDAGAAAAEANGRAAAAHRQIHVDLTIGPLDDAGIADLVSTVLPGIDLTSTLAGLLITRCQGNPFITLEYLRAIVDAGLLRPHWGSWVLDIDGLSALDLPEDAVGLVLARTGGLDDESRQLLAVAAAIGTSFGSDVVAEVSAVDSDLAMSAMAQAASLHLIDLREGGEYEFLHARIREALLDGLGESHLVELHQTIAEVLDRRYREGGAARSSGAGPQPEQTRSPVPVNSPAFVHQPASDRDQIFAMARHYLQGDPRRAVERAHAVCRRAGQLSMVGHAPAQAVVFLEHANRLQPGDAQLLYLLGVAHQRDGAYSKSVAYCAQALGIERDRLRRTRLLLLLTEVERSRWNSHEAQAALEQGLTELDRPLPKPGSRRALSMVMHAVAGLIVALTGWGFATARGQERQRDALTAALHAAGAYVATVAMRPGRRLMHSLLGLLSLNRLGAGPDYAVGMSGLGFMLNVIGVPVLGSRVLDEAETAARELNDPQLLAVARWEIGISEYMTGRDDGELWEEVLHQHGRWLDAGHVSDAVASIAWEAAVMGRIAQARTWYQTGLQLVDFSSKGEITSLITLGIVTSSAAGRTIEAAGELRRAGAVLDRHTGPGLRVNLVLAEMHALVEQGELGRLFDEAAANFFALDLDPRVMIRQHRLFFVVHAFGRLARCRLISMDDAQLQDALAQAQHAVGLLRRTASTPATRAFAQVARAQLDVLQGRPARALRTLSRIAPQVREAPILSYELACTTARALAASGFEAQARERARIAQVVAEEAGLTRRARWVGQEFGLAGRASARSGAALATTSLEPFSGLGSASSAAGGIERQRLQALQDISRAAAKVLDPVDLARICLDRTLHILSAERAALFLVDTDNSTGPSGGDDERAPLRHFLSLDAAGHDLGELTAYSTSLVERVRETREPIVITGTEEGAALGAQSVVLHGLRSILVAPLQLEGRLLGVVYLDSQIAKGIFTADDAGILLALMTHIATSLETARAAELQVRVRTAQQERDLAESLRQALDEMSAALEPGDVLARLLTSVRRVLPDTNAWLLTQGSDAISDEDLLSLAGNGPIQGDARMVPPAALGRLIGDAGAWTVIPLHAGDPASEHAVVGLLVLAARAAATRAEAQTQVARALAAQAMTAYDRATLFAQVQELAVVDDLTGIPNRRRFFEVADRDFTAALRHGRPLQAMMIDIDHFKRVNDIFGHATGDEVIREVATRLYGQVRETDILGRYGGEEFALVLPDTPDGAELAERLRAAVEEAAIPTRSGPITVTVSVGVAQMHGDDADIGAVLARADERLYEAKNGGRNRVEIG